MYGFNWFDLALLLILLGSVAAGLKAGFTRVVIHLFATVAGLLAAFWCYRLVGEKLLPYLNENARVANLFGFLIIFIGVMLIGSAISLLLSRIFRWIGLSWFDHLMGGLAGVLRGAIVITVLVDILVAFTPPPPPAYLDHSRILPYTNQFAGWLIDIAPRELKDSFNEQMHHIRRFWTSPAGSGQPEQA